MQTEIVARGNGHLEMVFTLQDPAHDPLEAMQYKEVA